MNFFQLIWFCYRKDFKRLLANDVNEVEIFLTTVKLAKDRVIKIGLTNDIGWGCTIRVGQMVLAHAIRRHFCKDYLDIINEANAEKKVDILCQMNDNADGAQGPFSI